MIDLFRQLADDANGVRYPESAGEQSVYARTLIERLAAVRGDIVRAKELEDAGRLPSNSIGADKSTIGECIKVIDKSYDFAYRGMVPDKGDLATALSRLFLNMQGFYRLDNPGISTHAVATFLDSL